MNDNKYRKRQAEADKLLKETSQSAERAISFDTFFQILLKEGKVLAHHKPPMRHFAEVNGITSGTRAEFERLFKSY
jgi:hypothetical protein